MKKSPISVIKPICFQLNCSENSKYNTVAHQRTISTVKKLGEILIQLDLGLCILVQKIDFVNQSLKVFHSNWTLKSNTRQPDHVWPRCTVKNDV